MPVISKNLGEPDHSSTYYDYLDSHVISKEVLAASLPKVGDILMKSPHIVDSGGGHGLIRFPKTKCVVTFVNTEHLWYEVQFLQEGITFRECYKVPELKTRTQLRRELFFAGDRIEGVRPASHHKKHANMAKANR